MKPLLFVWGLCVLASLCSCLAPPQSKSMAPAVPAAAPVGAGDPHLYTYFSSQQQLKALREIAATKGVPFQPLLINGRVYTECRPAGVPPFSRFTDSVVVTQSAIGPCDHKHGEW